MRPSRLQPLCGLRLRTALCSVCSPLQPFGPPMLASSFAVLLASLGSSYRPALRWPGIPGLRTPFGRVLAPPPLRGFDGLTTACFRHRRRPSCAPQSASPPAFLNSAWSSHTFAPPCANACAVFRPCGLRFAPCPRGSSRFAASDARKLACGSPCFIGLTTACFRHWRRPSCAPALRLRGVPCLRTSCARHSSPSGLHLFASICIHSSQSSICNFAPCRLRRPGVPWLRTALRSVCSPLQPFGSQTLASSLAALVAHWAYFALLRPQGARFVRPTKNARNDVHAVISD